jgi:hypothetical protein
MAAVVLLSAPVAALSVANGRPTLGLMERITIGGVEVWLLATAWWTLRHDRAPAMSLARLPRTAEIG